MSSITSNCTETCFERRHEYHSRAPSGRRSEVNYQSVLQNSADFAAAAAAFAEKRKPVFTGR